MADQPPPAYTQSGAYSQPQQAGPYPPPQQSGAYPPPQQGGAYPQKMPPPDQPYPQPGQAYPPQQNVTIIATQPMPTTMAVITFGEVPVTLICPYCQCHIETGVSFENGDKVWLWMVVFCLIGGLLCFWIPLVIDSLKDVHHHCPNCKRVVGTFKR